MKIDIEDIKKINLNPGETLVVQVDCAKLPPKRRAEYLHNTARLWRQVFPDKSIGIVVIETGTTLAVVGPTDPEVLKIDLSKVDPISQCDYDHAMGVIK